MFVLQDPPGAKNTGQPAGAAKHVLEELEGRFRPLGGWWRRLAFIVGIAMSAFHLYILGVHPIDPWFFKASHLFFASVLVFMLVPALKRTSPNRVTAVDFLFIILSGSVLAYIMVEFDQLIDRMGTSPNLADVLVGVACVLVVLEMTRRCAGLALPLLAVCFIFYGLFGGYFPGLFGHRGYGFQRTISVLFSPDGVYGLALNASALYVFLFILFGAFLSVSGASQFFTEVAIAAAGRYRGGPAKVSVISSALFGTVSGSSVANVVVDGVINIPLMKATGFSPSRAAAIEAMTSTGGQIIPPVMGVAAFLMAEVLGTPYSRIATAAIIPGILYYVAAYWMIDFESAKNRISGLQREAMPHLRDALIRRGHLIIPLILLIFLLMVVEFSPTMSVLYALGATLVVSWSRVESRIDLRRLLTALYQGAEGAISIAATCATAGIIVGILSLTGIGMKFASIVTSYSFGYTFVALLLTMLITLILGLGMPTIAAYAISASVVAPALIELGIPALVAHFFVFYFAILSAITPPVALATYAAAALAKAPMREAGLLAFRYSLAGFLIPFAFVYGPSLLLVGTWAEIVVTGVSSALGVMALAAGLQGWLLVGTTRWERLLLLAGALCLITPEMLTDLVGYSVIALVTTIQWLRRRRAISVADFSTSRSGIGIS